MLVLGVCPWLKIGLVFIGRLHESLELRKNISVGIWESTSDNKDQRQTVPDADRRPAPPRGSWRQNLAASVRRHKKPPAQANSGHQSPAPGYHHEEHKFLVSWSMCHAIPSMFRVRSKQNTNFPKTESFLKSAFERDG